MTTLFEIGGFGDRNGCTSTQNSDIGLWNREEITRHQQIILS